MQAKRLCPDEARRLPGGPRREAAADTESRAGRMAPSAAGGNLRERGAGERAEEEEEVKAIALAFGERGKRKDICSDR